MSMQRKKCWCLLNQFQRLSKVVNYNGNLYRIGYCYKCSVIMSWRLKTISLHKVTYYMFIYIGTGAHIRNIKRF